MSDFATSMARVAVLPSKIWDGMNRLEDAAEGGKAQPIETYPLAEAFGRSWTTDAHFVIYLTAPFDPRRQFFRIHKPCLREIRTKEFVDVHAGLIALDWDNVSFDFGRIFAHWHNSVLRSGRLTRGVDQAECRAPADPDNRHYALAEFDVKDEAPEEQQ